jgi:hypothetical protein
MKTSIKNEFEQRAIDYVNDGILTIENQEDWHYYLFNEDYYVIGYYNAEQWLNEHDISAFEAIQVCQQYEKDNFGECRIYDNAEALVNMYTYILGEEWMYEGGEDFILELIK